MRTTQQFKAEKLFVILGVCVWACGNSPAFAETPFVQVEQAIAELEAGLDGRRDELQADPAALYAMIDEIFLPRFNRAYAAQLVLGRSWRDASDSQKERFVDAFYNSLLRKYADGVLEFRQDQVQLLPFRGDLEKPRVIVKTKVTLEDGTRVDVNYGFANRENGWQMFDVTIEGISYIRNFRTELAAEIKSSSLDAVIERLEGDGSAALAESPAVTE